MKNEEYFVGLDIGTDSVGYAVTDERYNLCKFKGEPMWGVTLFDEAQLAVARRSFRVARRRLDRRQQRVQLLMELFAKEIEKIDNNFFKRIKESYLYPETPDNKIRLFNTYEAQKAYVSKYPTIHHLIFDLMTSTDAHDVRLVYIACAWLVAHRGHFLSEVDKTNIDAVTDFTAVYNQLAEFIRHDGYVLPWREDVNLEEVQNVLKSKLNKSNKAKALGKALFGTSKVPKEADSKYEYNYDLIIKLLCGSKVSLSDLFGKDEYKDLEEKTVALNMDDEKLDIIMHSIDDDAELIQVLKAVYDWSVLVDVLKGKTTISEAKISVYDQHKSDLKALKQIVKKYVPERYSEIFRSEKTKNNYVAYIGKNQTANESVKTKKSNDKEEFCKYISSVLKSVKPENDDFEKYNDMVSCLDTGDFMPKQVDGDNRVIPYQLYWYELNKILENAKAYIPFLEEKDEDGVTGAEKIISVFEFRVPYYVGPLKENPNNDKRVNHWMVRKAEGKIYPWNFDSLVDLDESENAFISRMTNSCTYLPGEDVLPKNSLVYCAFEVLNEINNIKINGNEISVSLKQGIYNNVFMRHGKVTPKHIKDYLVSNNYINSTDVMSGIDVAVKSSLKPFLQFKNLVNSGILSYSDVENIINRATYSEDNFRFRDWVRKNYKNLPESEIKYISGLKFKNFGRLSKKFLCGIEGAVNPDTGEYMSIIRTMWETNYNLMQLLSDKFDFGKNINKYVKEHYGLKPQSITERLDEMYVSNSVKRPIIRTLDILKDVAKVQGKAPKMIFIEMARGAGEDQKGKRTVTRLQQIRDLYEKVDTEEIRYLTEQLDGLGVEAHNKLQSDKLFLYFIQLGKCLYTGQPISIESVLSGNGSYNIDHIYPRSFVKDDSIINNKILVDSKANGEKSDVYPVDRAIREKMYGYWMSLNKLGLMSDEKFRRLTRTTPFTEDEKFEFINRQLVETRQSTKVVASLLKELYPESEIVYVKAGLVSDFRQQFDLIKSRSANDLHHAKDAYLNIVVGNVWHHKFSRQFWRKGETHNAKAEIVFTNPVVCNGKTVWTGVEDKNKTVKIAQKNTAHMTMYSYCKHSGQNGGFFDQNPLSAKEGLIPLKKDLPTEIYGGYDSATVSGFVLVKYKNGKNPEISFVPLKLLFLDKFLNDEAFAKEYIRAELGEKATDIEILFNRRVIKIYSEISLDGACFTVRGKANASSVGLMNLMPFKTCIEKESYIKRIESINEKYKKNPNYIWNEKFDKVSKQENDELFLYFIEKLRQWPYNKRPGMTAFVEKLEKRITDFSKLDIFSQAYVLLQILGVFGRIKQADLKDLSESPSSGIASLSLNLSNWKKNYSDVRIIDRSASGLFETVSDNLLELL